MSQPSQEPGEPQQDDPRTVPQVEQFESQTVPQIPQRQPAFETRTVPQVGSQQAQYGQPGYGYPRRRNRMAWGVLGGGLFVVGMVLTLVLVLNRGPDTDTPEGVAEAVADAFSDHDFDELTALSCDKEDLADTVDVLNGYGSQFGATARVDDVDTIGDDRAVAELTLTYTTVPDELSDVLEVGDVEDVELGLTAENGEWCVSSLSG